MAYTLTDIANSALIKIGEKPLQSLDDDTPQGRVVSLRLRSVMDTVLTMHPFTCAMRRVNLVPSSGINALPTYEFVFRIPNDTLRTLSILDRNGDQIYDFAREGESILCNYPSITLIYTRSLYGAGFVAFDVAELISLYLSYDICERLDPNPQRRQQLYSEFHTMLAMIKAADARSRGPRSYGPINVFGPSMESLDRPNEIVDARVR